MTLLINPDFNEGYYHADDVPELAVPWGWELYYIDNDTFPGCGNPPAYRPESVVWNIKDAPEHEKGVFFLHGDYCLKVFKAHAPVYFALTQLVTNLTAGAKYRFTAQVFPDIVKGYREGSKVGPDDVWHAESRVGWSDPDTPWPRAQEGDVNWSDWCNVPNGNLAFGEYNCIAQDFIAPASGEVRVWLECKAKWGSAENNWFMDAFSLDLVEPAPEGDYEHVAEPEPEGDYEHVSEPQPGPEPEHEPVPEPELVRGAPRVQYGRTYLLLPQSLQPQMVVAAMRLAYGAFVTVGFSADDAGIGDLDERRVVAVNPDQIGTGLTQAWYDEYYPGVVFVPIYAGNADELQERLRSAL